MALEGYLDDLIANCLPEHRQELNNIFDETQRDILHQVMIIKNKFQSLMSKFPEFKSNRKMFVDKASKYYPECFSALMALFSHVTLKNESSYNDFLKIIHKQLIEVYRQKYYYKIIQNIELEE